MHSHLQQFPNGRQYSTQLRTFDFRLHFEEHQFSYGQRSIDTERELNSNMQGTRTKRTLVEKHVVFLQEGFYVLSAVCTCHDWLNGFGI